MLELIILTLATVLCTWGSITDLRTREVPDRLNYVVLALAFFLRIGVSIWYSDWKFIVDGLFGFAVMLAGGMALYYSGQWGGGDAKIVLAIGMLLGSPLPIDGLLFSFIINSLFAGGIYGLFYLGYLWKKNNEKVLPKIQSLWKRTRVLRGYIVGIWIVSVLLAIVLLFGTAMFLTLLGQVLIESLLVLPTVALITYFLYVVVRAVEQVALLVHLLPAQLTEGDWIERDVIVAGKRICGPNDLGITKEQITTLKKLYKQGKIETVFIKQGIPFVPTFLLGLILTMLVGNGAIVLMNII